MEPLPVRRKSMRPVDRAPQIQNRPSSSPVRLMTRPHSALSRTIGDDAPQFSSFTPDGCFPQALGANRAPKGRNEIDKELMTQQQRVVRAHTAKRRDKERAALTRAYFEALSLTAADVVKQPPTVDPHTLHLSYGSNKSSSHQASRTTSPPLTVDDRKHPIRPTSASSWIAALSPSDPSSADTEGATMAADSCFSGVGGVSASHLPFSRPTSAASVVSTTAVVPRTFLGSRPTTPSVYVGGRCQPELRMPPSSEELHQLVPSESSTKIAAAASPANAVSGKKSAAVAAPHQTAHQKHLRTPPSLHHQQPPTVAPAAALVVQGRPFTSAFEDSTSASHQQTPPHPLLLSFVVDASSTRSLLSPHASASSFAVHQPSWATSLKVLNPTESEDGLVYGAAGSPIRLLRAVAAVSSATSSIPLRTGPPGESDTSGLMMMNSEDVDTSKRFQLLQRRSRHATQTKPKDGFNISTCSVINVDHQTPGDVERQLSSSLLSRPKSADPAATAVAAASLQIRYVQPSTAATRNAAAGYQPQFVFPDTSAIRCNNVGAKAVPVYPLRSVFLS